VHFPVLSPRLLREAATERSRFGVAIALGLLGGVLTVLQARALSRSVTAVFLGGQTLADVRLLLVGLLALAAARAAAIWGSQATAGAAAVQVKTHLRERLYAHVLALGPVYARGEHTGELTNTLVEGLEALDAYFGQYLPQLALAVLTPATILLFVFPLDALSGFVLLLTAPLIPLFMVLIGDMADAQTRRQWTALSRMSAHFLDVLQGLATLKLFNRSREEIRAIARISDWHRDATMKVLRVAFLSALALEMIATLSTAVVAVEIGLRVLAGGARLTFEQGFFVLIVAPEFYLPLRLLGGRFHAGMAGIAAAERVWQVLDTPSRVGEPRAGRITQQGAEATPPCGAIAFSDVSYTYPASLHPALDGVSFDIPAGARVALVGQSGAGKSTATSLLLRFIEPQAGKITLNGEPISRVPTTVWRKEVAWVPQTPYLFNASISENIRLGRPDALPDAVVKAARQACADDFIRALPQGYNTVVGERGSRLSGGQAQRIALARAFLMDARLVIMDEATSDLDPDLEAEVQAAMGQLLAGRSALLIAHRLSTTRAADEIVVLEAGCVVQKGSHDQLILQDGAYRRMVGAARCSAFSEGVAESGGSPTSRQEALLAQAPRLAYEEPEGQGPSTSIPRMQGEWGVAVLLRLLHFVAPSWRWVLLSVLLGAATIGAGIGLMGTSAWILASAALHPSIAELQVAIVGVRFFGISRGLLRYAERLVSHQTTFRVLARLRAWFYARVEPLAPAGLAGYRSGDLLSRIVADVSTLENLYVRAVAPPAVAVLVAALACAWMATLDRRLALCLLVFLILAGVGLPLLTRALSRRPSRSLVQVRARLNAALVDGIQGEADLLAFGCEGTQLDSIRALGQRLAGVQRSMATIGGLNDALEVLLSGAAVAALLALAAPLVTSGRLSGVSVAVIALVAVTSFEAVLPLPGAAQHLGSCLEAGRRLFEIAGADGCGEQESTPRPARRSRGGLCLNAAPIPVMSDRGAEVPAIVFSSVRFRYAPDEPWALDDASFEVPRGGRVAVVGPSGAGKTTLVNLLARFWDYNAGRILLNGCDLRDVPPEEARRQISVVTQDPYLFNGTIRENLLLARSDATQEEIDGAIRQAQLSHFIAAQPQGYATWIGEGGLRLSGGERQRLAIARALLKNAPILVLDEPTADLDPITERALMEDLIAATRGYTTLIITHRPAVARTADEIIVLRGGRVVERGTHLGLLARDGVYQRMWELQCGVLE